MLVLSLRSCWYITDALPDLTLIISDNESRCDLDATLATENAIAAVTKMCIYLENQVPLESVLPTWLSWLPVYEDKVETPHVYSYLCKLIERWVWWWRTQTKIQHPILHSKNPLILGENNCNYPKIVQIFTRVVEEDGLSESPETYARFLSICRHIQVSWHSETCLFRSPWDHTFLIALNRWQILCSQMTCTH